MQRREANQRSQVSETNPHVMTCVAPFADRKYMVLGAE